MHAEVLMAKLTAKGLVITGQAGGSTGDVLTWADVSAGLGGLHRNASELMRTMYLQDHRGDAHLLTELFRQTHRLAVIENITISDRVANGLAFLALFEMVNPPCCKACSGLGQVRLRGGTIRVCERCEGAGLSSRSLREQALIATINHEEYRTKYQNLAGRVYQVCARWHADGLAHLSRRMRNAA